MTGVDGKTDLFVVGAMKAATTGLCDWLDAQPGVALSDPKEPAVFVSDDGARAWEGRLDTLFAGAAPDDVRVDGSTHYAKFPSIGGVPARVLAHNPDARIVYLMRHPVARTISQYRFEWFMGADTMPFERALEVNPQLVDNSRYALQLRQWLEVVAPERVLLVFAEAFGADPEGQVRRVLDHAGLPDRDVVHPGQERSNETDVLVRKRSLARRVLRDSAFGRRVRPYVPSWVASTYRRRLQEKSRPEVTAEVEARLGAIFDEDLADLRALTGGPELTCGSWTATTTTWTPSLRPA